MRIMSERTMIQPTIEDNPRRAVQIAVIATVALAAVVIFSGDVISQRACKNAGGVWQGSLKLCTFAPDRSYKLPRSTKYSS